MDPNLIARLLQMARMRQMQGGGQNPMAGLPQAGMSMAGGGMPGGGAPPGMPGPSPLRGFPPPPGQDMPLAVGTGQAPMAPPGGLPPQGMYGSAPGGLQNQQMPMSQMFQPPPPQAEMALQQAGGQPMNPMIQQIMRHLGMLNMLRNRAAQPFSMTQGY